MTIVAAERQLKRTNMGRNWLTNKIIIIMWPSMGKQPLRWTHTRHGSYTHARFWHNTLIVRNYSHNAQARTIERVVACLWSLFLLTSMHVIISFTDPNECYSWKTTENTNLIPYSKHMEWTRTSWVRILTPVGIFIWNVNYVTGTPC